MKKSTVLLTLAIGCGSPTEGIKADPSGDGAASVVCGLTGDLHFAEAVFFNP